MDVPSIDSEPRVGLAEPVYVDVRHHVDRRAGFRVPEDPLEVALYRHVRRLVAIEDARLRVLRQRPRAAPRDPLVPGHRPLDERGEDRDDERGLRVLLVGEGIEVGPERSRRDHRERG